MLGPARFTHIETCTRQVCQKFKAFEEIEELIPQLEALDEEIARLRVELATLKNPSALAPATSSTPKTMNYISTLTDPEPDVAKAQRLIKARRMTLQSLKASIARLNTTGEDAQ